jgi:ADP-ribose pyrophosphatase
MTIDEGSARVLDTQRVYTGRLVKVDLERLTLPNGHEIELEIIRHPGAAAVVPVRKDLTVVLIQQYRRAAGGVIFEVPAGKLDPGETPETCARREVQEEAGLEVGRLHPLGPIHTTPGFTDEIIHLFAATELTAIASTPEAGEVIEVVEMPLAEALRLAARGAITDSKTLCALFRLDQELRAGRFSP